MYLKRIREHCTLSVSSGVLRTPIINYLCYALFTRLAYIIIFVGWILPTLMCGIGYSFLTHDYLKLGGLILGSAIPYSIFLRCLRWVAIWWVIQTATNDFAEKLSDVLK